MSKRYQGNIISATPQVPANNYQDTPASGVWGMYEVEDLIKRGLWPTLGNLDPGKFIENIFSTYLYTGNNTTNAINNGIDLDGESGIVWIKNRDQLDNHYVFGGESGNDWTKLLTTNSTGYYGGATNIFDGVSSTGFTVKSDFGGVNTSGEDYASWTFRKAPKFFDVVTYTGTGANQSISHNLGSTPGAIFVKRTDSSANWAVQHRSTTNTDGLLYLNLTNAEANGFGTVWNGRATSTAFTVGTSTAANTSGASYVAYLFAHNDGDGGFGINGNQDIIKCGSYTGNGSLTGPEIDLGFEPQWLLVKRSSSGANWLIIDNMRGFTAGDRNDALLYPNLNNAEAASNYYVQPTPTGFQPVNSTSEVNASGSTYIYIAIRRGPMAVPTTATGLFSIDTSGATSPTPPRYTSGFPVDMALRKTANTTSNWELLTRAMQGTSLRPNATNAEDSGSGADQFYYMDGYNYQTTVNTNQYSWMWRRAPKYFDIVNYTGTGSSLTVNHNLGVEPDMIWLKDRDGANPWIVQGKVISPSNNSRLELNDTMALTNLTTGVTALTSTSFTLGTFNNINVNNTDYVAYLFGSVDGVSKVGTYTGDGNTEQNIDCGFTDGSRFVLIKKTSHTGSWFLFDSERGIISGNSPYLQVNQTAAESSSYNELSPYSSGFTVRNGGGLNLNYNGHTFAFYAIA